MNKRIYYPCQEEPQKLNFEKGRSSEPGTQHNGLCWHVRQQNLIPMYWERFVRQKTLSTKLKAGN